jgi:orotidine-5'-phosphate decarboxylase
MQRPLIIALDFPNLLETKKFLAKLDNEKLFVKVGMELFYQEGPAIIQYIKDQGHSIFLDLKLHDIPNTVKSAMKGLAKLDVDIVNVHAAGGIKMMEAALEGLHEGTNTGKQRPLCIAVTQLTSTSEVIMKDELLIGKPLNDVVLHYASLAKHSGLDGVVCSSLEVPFIKEQLGSEFMTVTPGIRLTSDVKGDQHRVVTPEDARLLGSTAIVVGRSITTSIQPIEAYNKIKLAWEGVQI